jgi:hypothetical protein
MESRRERQIRARLMQKISTPIASAAESSDSARDCGIWIISSRSIARRDSNRNHCQSGIAGRDRDSRAGVFRTKIEHASATDPIDKDVQLDEKKSKCRHGQSGAYPGKKGSLVRRVVCVVSDH